MASLSTNLTAFLIIAPIGIRRMVCSISLYLKNPSQYKSRIWYFSESKWRNFDFFTLLVLLPFASFSQLFFFLAFSGHPTFKFSFLNQSLVIFLFWVLLILINFRGSLGKFDINEGFLYVFAGIGFLVEYMMNGRGVIGVGGMVYGILGGLGVLCGGCCLYLGFFPKAFFAEFMLSAGLILKATWVLQVGLSLYTDAFGFKGCDKVMILAGQGVTDVKCALEEDKLRGMALMNLVFIGHTIVVIVFSFVVFGVLHCNKRMRYGETSGPLLGEIGSERVQMMPTISEFEIE
ncbi:hypothetical protein Leryth_016805 [Lithospermum erythrorhizon]|nr:hypothetical protein Leryth_016805 [Lithospermum erythrorhizon]